MSSAWVLAIDERTVSGSPSERGRQDPTVPAKAGSSSRERASEKGKASGAFRRVSEILALAVALAFSYSTAQAQSFSAPTLGATTYSKAQINLTWTDPNPNAPLNPNESGYIVERAEGTATSYTKVFTSAANVTSWASTGLSTGTLYYYRVRAYGVVNGQTQYSDYSYASATTQSSLYPNPARSLIATALSPTQMTLKWSDRSSNEAGYKVERATSSTGPWAQIGTTAPSAISYTDSALTPSTAYYYRVIAYNSTGDSPPSNVATGTTTPDSTPPTVSISSPASGSTYSVAQTVEIRATAPDYSHRRRRRLDHGDPCHQLHRQPPLLRLVQR